MHQRAAAFRRSRRPQVNADVVLQNREVFSFGSELIPAHDQRLGAKILNRSSSPLPWRLNLNLGGLRGSSVFVPQWSRPLGDELIRKSPSRTLSVLGAVSRLASALRRATMGVTSICRRSHNLLGGTGWLRSTHSTAIISAIGRSFIRRPFIVNLSSLGWG